MNKWLDKINKIFIDTVSHIENENFENLNQTNGQTGSLTTALPEDFEQAEYKFEVGNCTVHIISISGSLALVFGQYEGDNRLDYYHNVQSTIDHNLLVLKQAMRSYLFAKA